MVKWNDLPVEIQEKMLEEQVRQGNKRNPEIFIIVQSQTPKRINSTNNF